MGLRELFSACRLVPITKAGLDKGALQVAQLSAQLSLESEEFLVQHKEFDVESSKTSKLLPRQVLSSLSLMKANESNNASGTKIKFEGELDFKIHLEEAGTIAVSESHPGMTQEWLPMPVRQMNYSRRALQIDSVVDLEQILSKEKKFMEYVRKNGYQL